MDNRGEASAPLVIAGKNYRSRLMLGTGKFKDLDETKDAIEASGAQIITLAVRRMDTGRNDEDLLKLFSSELFSSEKYTPLPNTAGCYDAESAVRTARLARELFDGHKLIKLEVLGDKKTLFPDVPQTLIAAETLIKEDFEVMVYTNDDPVTAGHFAGMGCVAVMPLAAPIGSGLGIRNRYNVRAIVENVSTPVIVDAGVGTASDAAVAMELGCDGVLMNTAIAEAKRPVLMAGAMKKAVEAGRAAFLAGRMPKRAYASASSPADGVFF